VCVEICALPAETGPCRASKQRYFYDVSSGTCRQFTYGGCNGNANRFLTLDNCRQVCEYRNTSEPATTHLPETVSMTPVDSPTLPITHSPTTTAAPTTIPQQPTTGNNYINHSHATLVGPLGGAGFCFDCSQPDMLDLN